jgi:hypothetical protein
VDASGSWEQAICCRKPFAATSQRNTRQDGFAAPWALSQF